MPDHDLRGMIGPPMQDVFFTLSGGNADLVADAIAHYRDRYARVGLYENEVYPGIPEALATLAQSHRLFVCTSKPHNFAIPILEHFDLARHFAGIYGCELDGTRADKRELLAWLIEREHVEPDTAAMIGDRKFDIAAAVANGLVPIGVLWGHGNEAELREAGADVCLSEPDELAGFFNRPTNAG